MLLSVTKHMTIFQRRHPNGGVITRVIVRWKTGSVIMPNVTARRRQWQWISTVTAIACVFQPSTVACFRDYRWFAVTRRRNYFRYYAPTATVWLGMKSFPEVHVDANLARTVRNGSNSADSYDMIRYINDKNWQAARLVYKTESSGKFKKKKNRMNKKYVLSNSESIQCNFFIFDRVTSSSKSAAVHKISSKSADFLPRDMAI